MSSLWCWGYNDYGALGDNTTNAKSSPVQTVALSTDWSVVHAGYLSAIALRDDGTLWTWGRGDNGNLGDLQTNHRSSPVMIANGKTWKSISGSTIYYGCSGAIDNNDHIFVWGYNYNGQLGLGDDGENANRSSPVQMGNKTWIQISSSPNSMGAIDTDGKLWMWGRNYDGELGLNNDTVNYSSPVQVGSDTNWVRIACGYRYAMAIKNDGTLWGWGRGEYGKTGMGDESNRSSPVQVGNDTNWAEITTSVYHSAAIKEDGSLWIWGRNDNGQLGQNDGTYRSSPVQISGTWTHVSCGGSHTAAIKKGLLFCWGENYWGNIGNGDGNGDGFTNYSSPIQTLMNFNGWAYVSAGPSYTMGLSDYVKPDYSKSCSEQECNVPAFKCYVGSTSSCTCAKSKFYTAQCSRIQQSLGICSGTSGAYVPAITVCNQKLL